MAKSIRSLVVWAGAASVSISAVIAAIGIHQINSLSGALSESTKTLEALRRHVEGDMLHDGLRADVLAALSNPAETGLPLEQVAADTAEHAAWFRRLVEENRAAGLSPAIQEALSAVEPALDAYINAATEIVRLAGTDRAAAVAALPRFNESFKALEESMEATSDQIQLTANQDADAAKQVAAWGPIILFAALAGAIAMLMALLALASKHVIRPISDLTDAMVQLSDGNLEIVPPHQDRQDELGHMARGLAHFREASLDRRNLMAQNQSAAAELDRASRTAALIQSFEAELAGVLSVLDTSFQDMERSANALVTVNATAQSQAGESTSSANAAASNVQNIAAAAEELTASINDISRSMTQSCRIAGDAFQLGRDADESVQSLAQAADAIGQVVSMIGDIAAQTNLLALNATIEAARAGESGRGFAVVASEVKTLASQTASATENITKRIAEVQAGTQRTVQAVRTVVGMIERVQALSDETATSANQQAAATQGISTDVAIAAESVASAASSAQSLHSATSQASTLGTQVMERAQSVQSQSERLREAAAGFFRALKVA
jgi:methyl-accepting chemotaxis protein